LRLKHIKLAGFKSFAEPIQIPVPGNLVGVVGPNGCGKSNVIDAVRWVLGESQAKHLRGETLQDVIFGGTSERKPQGRASVELVFENNEGRAPGQWAEFAEISVRRVLARDGVSTYSINNTTVRRRDVQDLFMGTGLGPRAYAIIEQGMISRIVESKPEEIRVFLEEAAGISKYKDRRRETELRLNDARANLSRTRDLEGEKDRQTEKLVEQARVAEQYRELDRELNRSRNLLLLARKKEAEAARARAGRDLDQAQVALEAEIARLRELELRLEEARQGRYALSDRVTQCQVAQHDARSQVTQLEAQLKNLREERQRLEERVNQLQALLEKNRQQRQTLEEAREGLQREQTRAAELVQVGQLRIEQEREALPGWEARVEQQRQDLDALRGRRAASQNAVNLAQSQQASAERLLQQVAERKTRLTSEQSALVLPDPGQMDRAGAQHREIEVAETVALATQGSLKDRLTHCETSTTTLRREVEAAQHETSACQARLEALQALQAKLGNNEKTRAQIERLGLGNLPRLWQGLEVENGWEDAVEAVLGLRLNAFEVAAGSAAAWESDGFPQGVTLFSAGTGSNIRPAALNIPGTEPLAQRITLRNSDCAGAIADALAGVYTINRNADALKATIPLGVTLVSREGHLYTAHTVSFFSPRDEYHGALARTREIEQHQEDLVSLAARLEDRRRQLAEAEAGLAACRAAQNEINSRIGALQSQRHALEVVRTRWQAEQERVEQRSAQIALELEQLATQEAEEHATIERCRAALTRGQAELAQLVEEVTRNEAALEEAATQRNARRMALSQAEKAHHDALHLEQGARLKIEAGQQALTALTEQETQTVPELELAREKLQGSSEETLQPQLQAALDQLTEAERIFTESKVAQENHDATLREMESQRTVLEQSLEPLRSRIGDCRVKQETSQNLLAQLDLDLEAAAADLADLEEGLQKGIRVSSLNGRITELLSQIEALGPVNHAALHELETTRQELEYLRAQIQDVEQAVATMEEAIAKIDHETRDKLKQTFDLVNSNFSELFTTLFGGGQARIQLTGEEILDAGVQIMAHPPGKKNSSIHLLSGGEKALTAVALVFSMFRLNPAPFCMLDEVDAPLDDSNTERFVNLVKKMSEQTQFLYITHNKIAMEMANQLIGITMAESGVSRMVAVDVDEAVRLTQDAA
jgi:chromosome segregation protein